MVAAQRAARGRQRWERVLPGLLVVVAVGAAACEAGRSRPDGAPAASSAGDSSAADNVEPSETPATRSAGCGLAAAHPSGGVQVHIDTGRAGGGERSFYLVLPEPYRSDRAHALVVGFHGTGWTGERMRDYLRLEPRYGRVPPGPEEIFVYPDALERSFPGWGKRIGWQLGPSGDNAAGTEDLKFLRAMVEEIERLYCVDTARVFATGQSWGGDISMVVGCLLGDVFRAVVPVASNRPYFFEDPRPRCTGETAAWVMFGEKDTFFTRQSHPGQLGEECRDFWLTENLCDGVGASHDLGIVLADGSHERCVEYTGCQQPTRYCRYGGRFGHGVPEDYYARETMRFFRSF